MTAAILTMAGIVLFALAVSLSGKREIRKKQKAYMEK